jgi:SAM-dependent methyltransferase
VGRRVAILLDARSREDFLRGHAPGAAHLPEAAWRTRAAELPPREDPVDLVADTPESAARLAEELVARGFAHARAADAPTFDDRSEAGPARAVAWRPASALPRCAPLLPARGRALDVACGAGRDVAWLAARGLDTIGLDVLPDALGRARLLGHAAAGLAADAPMRPRARTAFVCADAAEAPLREGAFDLVTGFRYLERTLFTRLSSGCAPAATFCGRRFRPARTPLATRGGPAFGSRRASLRTSVATRVSTCSRPGRTASSTGSSRAARPDGRLFAWAVPRGAR